MQFLHELHALKCSNAPLDLQTHSKDTHCPGLSCRCTHVYSLQPPQPPLYINTKLLSWLTVHKWPCVDWISACNIPPPPKKAFSLRNDTQTTRLLFNHTAPRGGDADGGAPPDDASSSVSRVDKTNDINTAIGGK